jgi:acyl-CoA dehydrogenase
MNFPKVELAAYLRAKGLSRSQEVSVAALTGGQSNPTWLLDDGARRWVLRKKPPGELLASAHAIDREYRVMRALRGSGVPVPEMVAYCEDESVVGAPFFLMEFLEGRIFVDQSLPTLSPLERGAIYRDMNRVIAALHGQDYAALGLRDFGKPGNYFNRQIARWSRQCTASTLPLPAAMLRLMEWLPQHIPADDETTLLHGDYRMDNLVFHPTEPRVIGVLDWELSTLGHPLADFAYQCMAWRIPHSLWRGIGGLDLASLGIPSEDEYMAMYVEATGRDPSAHWDYYLAYNLFRMSAILQGIAQRATTGSAAAIDAAETGRKAEPLAELGWQVALRYQAGLGYAHQSETRSIGNRP